LEKEQRNSSQLSRGQIGEYKGSGQLLRRGGVDKRTEGPLCVAVEARAAGGPSRAAAGGCAHLAAHPSACPQYRPRLWSMEFATSQPQRGSLSDPKSASIQVPTYITKTLVPIGLKLVPNSVSKIGSKFGMFRPKINHRIAGIRLRCSSDRGCGPVEFAKPTPHSPFHRKRQRSEYGPRARNRCRSGTEARGETFWSTY